MNIRMARYLDSEREYSGRGGVGIADCDSSSAGNTFVSKWMFPNSSTGSGLCCADKSIEFDSDSLPVHSATQCWRAFVSAPGSLQSAGC